ncbi:MAG: hypothetical protein WAM89_13095 [Terriglobales bacterium]
MARWTELVWLWRFFRWWMNEVKELHISQEWSMNLSKRGKNFLPKWSVLLILVFSAVTLFAGGPKPPAPAKSAPSKPTPKAAPAQHNAPAQHPGGNNAQHPGGANAGNRGAGANANANRPGQTGANRPGQTGANRPGQANANKPGQAGANRPGQTGANKPGQTGGNKPGQDNANRPGQAGGNKPGQAGGNRPGGNAGSHQPAGSKNVSLKGGGSATVRKDGSVRSVDRNGMHIEHGVHGGRTVVGQHNGARVVNTGKHGGYVQRPYVNRGGHSYYSRTYVGRDGRAYSGVYRGYNYGGHMYYGYHPGYYYGAGFYGWAYNPWPGPLAWGVGAWGWGGSPWFGFYGGWFNPYPFYAGPAFWLTDYLIAANLQAAYAEQAELAGGGVTPGINIVASQAWTDTGTQVFQGQTYTIAASGMINYSGGNPSTVASPAGNGGICDQGSCPAPGLPLIALVGKIGPAGIPFYVGNAKTLVAPADGELFLGVNDNYLPDNSGVWTAAIHQAGGDNSSGDQQAQMNNSGGGSNNGPAMTPEVKQAIADEVKAELAAQQAQAGQGGGSGDQNSGGQAPAPANGNGEVPPALDPARRTFVVANALSVTANGQECGLTVGDVLTRLTDTPDADNMVNAAVTATKKSDCAAGQTVAVKVDDLQEMQNHFDEQLNSGMGELAKKQGTGGMPKAPDTGTTASDVPPPAPDANAAKVLQDQQQAADQTDEQVKQEVAGSSGGGQ